jgi:hypothetical protein
MTDIKKPEQLTNKCDQDGATLEPKARIVSRTFPLILGRPIAKKFEVEANQ